MIQYSVQIGQHAFCISSSVSPAGLLLLLLLLHAYSCFWPLIAFVENTAVAADIRNAVMKWLKISQHAAGALVEHHTPKIMFIFQISL